MATMTASGDVIIKCGKCGLNYFSVTGHKCAAMGIQYPERVETWGMDTGHTQEQVEALRRELAEARKELGYIGAAVGVIGGGSVYDAVKRMMQEGKRFADGMDAAQQEAAGREQAMFEACVKATCGHCLTRRTLVVSETLGATEYYHATELGRLNCGANRLRVAFPERSNTMNALALTPRATEETK